VMTSAERARDFLKKPVYLLGVGEGHSHEHLSQAPKSHHFGGERGGRAHLCDGGRGAERHRRRRTL
jgi:hypothetical protein